MQPTCVADATYRGLLGKFPFATQATKMTRGLGATLNLSEVMTNNMYKQQNHKHE